MLHKTPLPHAYLLQLAEQGFVGCCITLPHKIDAYRLCDRLTSRAELAGSVNTIKFIATANDRYTIAGDNTDGLGLISGMQQLQQISFTNKRVLLLGSGGVAHGLLAPLLEQKPAMLAVYNRHIERAKQLLAKVPGNKLLLTREQLASGEFDFDIIINATSASVYRQSLQLPAQLVSANTICLECAYLANELTLFQQWARQHGVIQAYNGLQMLVMQAVFAIAFYIDYCVPESVRRAVVNELLTNYGEYARS